MTDRLVCAVPGCKRTTAPRVGACGWICGKHWALVPIKMRRAKARAKRRGRAELADQIWQRALREVTGRVLSGGDW